MKGKKILYVTSELSPYLNESELANQTFNIAKKMYKSGADVRIFMPKFGCINERRNQLHEVIRLSGMNLVINDVDQPLIIKVASIPNERMQVYFIDNHDFFKRKGIYADPDSGVHYKDNDERAIFFAKGLLETAKKLNWKPDIIHVNGWMGMFVPLFVKQFYKNDSFYEDVKIVVSLYDGIDHNSFDMKDILSKISNEGFDQSIYDRIASFDKGDFYKIIMAFSDVTHANNDTLSFWEEISKEYPFKNSQVTIESIYHDFYQTVV